MIGDTEAHATIIAGTGALWATPCSIDRARLHDAAATAGIDHERADAVWAALTAPREGEERFDAPHVAFYVGGLLVLSAFTWLMGEAWNAAGVGAALAMSLGAAAALSLLSAVLLRRGWRVPGGLVATVVVALVPLIVYSFERVVGIWPDRELGEYGDFYDWISGGWFAMEVATVLAALLALRLVGFPFLVMPLAFVAWFASMDFTEVVFGADASDRRTRRGVGGRRPDHAGRRLAVGSAAPPSARVLAPSVRADVHRRVVLLPRHRPRIELAVARAGACSA